jgi:hypothetical protein
MKTSLILLSITVITPAAIAIGLSTAAAISIVTAVGLGAVAIHDYASPISYTNQTRKVTVAKNKERLPFAA